MVGGDGKFFIKQFGLQRSGTNAVKALLEVNFPILGFNNLPW